MISKLDVAILIEMSRMINLSDDQLDRGYQEWEKQWCVGNLNLVFASGICVGVDAAKYWCDERDPSWQLYLFVGVNDL